MLDAAALRRSIDEFLDEESEDIGFQLAKEFAAADNYETKKDNAELAGGRLSPAFFEHCPGLIGRISREIDSYALQPYPSFSFAAACAVVGGLKAIYQRSEHFTTSPACYFFCFAPAGRGKDFPRKCMIQALGRAGATRFLSQNYRSSQGFHGKMASAGSAQIMLHDEAHHFFKSSKDAPHYIQNIKPMMLELFSSHDNPHLDAGAVLSAAGKLEPLIYPTLSYCGLGVPDGIEDAFSGRELTSGFFSRFLVFRDSKPVVALDEDRKLPKRFDFEDDPEWLEIIEQSSKFEIYKKTHVNCPDEIPFEYIKHTTQSLRDFQRYSAIIADRRNELTIAQVDVYNRAVEIAGRVALALSCERIDENCVLWAVNLVERALGAIELIAYEGGMGEEALILEKIFDIVQKEPAGISRANLYKRCQFIPKQRSRVLNDALQELALQGRLRKDKIQGQKRAGGPTPELIFAS